MPIQASVQNNQIQASVGETQIDVSVSGGFGPSGLQGTAATVAVGAVTTGAPGSSASVVNAGTSSAAVLNFTIPAGAPGAAGAAGAQGPAGPAGPAGTTTWAGITDKPSTFTPSTHQHVAADISDFTSAVIAAAPPTTNASLLTSGTLPDARLSANIARTSDVSSAVAAVVNAAPAALDTLNELAAALGNDASFSVTVTNALASKAPIANPTFTGTVSGITKSMVGLGNVPNVDATARANHTGTQAWSTIVSTPTTLAGYGITDAVGSSDARLTDARTPTAHKSTHATGGTDALTPADIGASAASHTHTANAITDFSSAVAAASPEEVVEYLTAANFPVTGNASLLYIATDASRAYRWVGAQYAEIGPTSISVSGGGGSYTLPAATTSTLGGVIVGAGLAVSSGTVSANVTSVAGRTGAVTIAAADVSGLGSLATQSSVAYSSLTGIPSTFAPASHNHAASEINSGTLANARLTTRARASMNLYLSSSFR